jgi:hypothetical protein
MTRILLALAFVLLMARPAAAAIDWVDASETTASGTTSPASCTKPSGIATGDLIVMAFAISGGLTPGNVDNVDITAPSGFTKHFSGAAGTNVPRAVFLTKTADGSEGATLDITYVDDDGAGGWRLVCSYVTGWNSGAALQIATCNDSTALVTTCTTAMAGQTTAAAGAMRLIFAAQRNGTTAAITASGFTDVANSIAIPAYLVGQEILGAAGAQSATNFTSDTAGRSAAITLYIEASSAACDARRALTGIGC